MGYGVNDPSLASHVGDEAPVTHLSFKARIRPMQAYRKRSDLLIMLIRLRL